MDRPAELIRRAALKCKKMPVREEEAPLPPAELPPRPVSHHASYTALMRSHDRVATRHIPRKS